MKKRVALSSVVNEPIMQKKVSDDDCDVVVSDNEAKQLKKS